MSIRVRRFDTIDLPAIARLNGRLSERGVQDRVYPESETTPSEANGAPISHELYVAVDEGEVRGGVWLHEHQFSRHGELIRAGWLKYPVGESLINREFGGVPGAMLMSVMRRQPELMALGMGSRAAPFAKLLAALGWTMVDVPFFAAPVRTGPVLVHLSRQRRSPMLERCARVVSASGLAAAVAAPMNALRQVRLAQLLKGIAAEPVTEFGSWADDVWHENRHAYGFIARRDAAMLNQFYPASFPRLTRLRVRRNGEDIGWVCTTHADGRTRTTTHGFGDLRVGMLADAMGAPTMAPLLLGAAIRYLVTQGVDIVVTNQYHRAWREPLAQFGFISRPTNFVFACSRRMATRLADDLATGDVFLNRGDCDGPPRWW